MLLLILHAFKKKSQIRPLLVWLSGLSTGPQTERSLVQFPARAHACIAPKWGCVRGNRSMNRLHVDVSFSPSLSKKGKKKEKEKKNPKYMVRYPRLNFSHTWLKPSIRSWLSLTIPREANPWKQGAFTKCLQGETHERKNKTQNKAVITT